MSENCIILGKGSEPLVAIPGLSTNKITTDTQILANSFKPLIDNFKIYLIDRPDYIKDGITNEDLAKDVYETIRAKGIKKACVIGVSQGGMIAQFLAAEHPECVEKLVLGSSMAEPNEMSERVIGNWIRLGKLKEYENLNSDIYQHIFSPEYFNKYADVIESFCKTMRPDGDERFVALAEAAYRGGSSECLKKIKCPVLVIGSENDQVLSGQASEYIASVLGCKLFMFKDAGHASYDETPEFYTICNNFFLNR